MKQGTAIVLWQKNIGYVLEQHQEILVESATSIRFKEHVVSELSAIEYLNNPNIQWQPTHFLQAILPWPTKIGYYKDKIVASVPSDSMELLHSWNSNSLDYISILAVLACLQNEIQNNTTSSSFELQYYGTVMNTPLNVFTKILGPAEIKELPQCALFGLTWFQWQAHWIPLLEVLTPEHRYIGIAAHSNGMWGLPLQQAPKLVHVPAQREDVLVKAIDVLVAQ